MGDEEVIQEFLIESNENLARLDQEMVQLEQHPSDAQLLASIFRTIHTIKGTCGFLGFGNLERVTHLAENLLSQLRDGKRQLTPELVTLILEAVDATRAIMVSIETAGNEGTETYDALCLRLQHVSQSSASAPVPHSPAAVESSRQPVEPPVASVAAPLPPPPMNTSNQPPSPNAVPAPVLPAGSPAAELPLPATGVEPDPSAVQRAHSVSDTTIRVAVGLLDKLMNLVGELVLTRNQILQFNAQQNDTILNATSQRLNLITTELQGGVMKTRMQPIGVVWNKLPRLVRDLSASFGKQIDLEMDGADTELDKTIIEAIKDPITHIIRNCCDHGIEKPDVRLRSGKPAQGRLGLRAFHEGGQVNIEINDDGAGIDVQRVKSKAIEHGLIRVEQAERLTERELLNLIFLPGFSTARQVTNVSGRGVGMDVVKTNIEKIGGVVDLTSRPGLGTTLKLKIPLTLAIIPGLVVTSNQDRYVIPQVSLLELIRLEGETGRAQIEWISGTPVYRLRGKLLPIAYLNQVLGHGAAPPSAVINIVVLQAEDRQFGLVVDTINDTQEIVVKPLGKQLKGLNCYAGATIMGDGRVALILDVLGIGQLSGVVQTTQEQSRGDVVAKDQTGGERQSFLLFRAGCFERLAVPLSLVARLEELPQSKIERASGGLVVQYRGQILPLMPLGSLLMPGTNDTAANRDPAQVIVFSSAGHSVGLMVEQIIDIVDETVTVRQTSERDGILGSVVIAKRVTDLLDLQAVLRRADREWFSDRKGIQLPRPSVLIADAAPFARSLLRTALEMEGYRISEAANSAEALRILERQGVQVVLSAMDLPPGGALEMASRMQANPELAAIPVLALAATPEQHQPHRAAEMGFAACQLKDDREGVLRSLMALASKIESQTPAHAATERS